MKRFIQTGVVFGTAFLLWQVSADARFLDLKKQEQAPVPQVTPAPVTPIAPPPSTVYKSKTETEGVSLQFEELTLLNVLKNIQDETGILFSIDPSLETVPFSARIQADNWEAAVRELLKGFSRVEVWTNNLETSRVWLLSGGVNLEPSPQAQVARRATRPAVKQARQAPKRQPRFRVAPAPAPAPKPVVKSSIRTEDLPPHILFEPGVLTFFKSKGIALPANVKNMFGPNLEGLPANMPISPNILNDPTFQGFLESKGIAVPQG